ncbi:helix-turn-helix transcriptional regulator [Pseudomaricurvus alkylphenolicus]|uniref:helix-turn-helix domain-containing protein n=1 Tax=Pseudomaricurvus alkylphenolicus TaxID=1306991 RepID=UPI0014215C15|nr:AraC family transcriptional regulator [Pseudomaricurvus alkylphenolicus]NIB45153.1 helix-turn-helix transcriptional regulator [Pseudomaricurvus alkylphenolicus]
MQSRSTSRDVMTLNSAVVELIERSLQSHIYWSGHNSSNCIPTEWRVLPFMVVLTVRKGEYQCIFDAAQVDSVRAGAGEVLLIPAGSRHRLVVDRATIADGLHIDFTLFHNLDVLSFYEVPMVVPAHQAEAIMRCADELTATLEEYKSTPNLNNIALKRCASFRLFYEILSVSQALPDKELRLLQVNRILPALELIENQLDAALKVEVLAAACALSRNAFSRLFKQVVGSSPLRYVNRKRLELAMSKLVYGDRPIAEIAKSVGFCD